MKKLLLSAAVFFLTTAAFCIGFLFLFSVIPEDSVAAAVTRLQDVLPQGSLDSVISFAYNCRPFRTPRSYEQYDFPAEFYPYYAALSDNQKIVYRQLYENALDCGASVVPDAKISPEELSEVYFSLLDDHPELFWLESNYKYTYVPGKSVSSVTMAYNHTSGNLERSKAVFEQAASELLLGLENLSPLEQERAVHDRLISRVGYDEANTLNQSAYSALVGNVSVCAGFSRAFQYLLQKLGIPCYYCTGSTGGEHAWNIVRLGSDYYHVDVLWDSTQPEQQRYRYFNLTDEEISLNHIRSESSMLLPACSGPSLLQAPDLPPEARHRYSGKIFTSLEEYRDAMENILVMNGFGNYSVTLTLADQTLYDRIFDYIHSGAYQEGFLQPALRRLNLQYYHWEISISGEPRNQGRVSIAHQIDFSS